MNKLIESDAPTVSIGAGAIDNTVVIPKKKSFKMWRRKKNDSSTKE